MVCACDTVRTLNRDIQGSTARPMPPSSLPRSGEENHRTQPPSPDQSAKISDSDIEEDPEEEEDPDEIAEEQESGEDIEVTDDDEEGDEEEAEEEEDEEVEVEEDVEVEEEVEVSSSPEKNNEDRTDISCDIKYKGHGRHLESSATQGKTESSLPSKALAVEDSSSNLEISGPSNEILMRSSKNPYLYHGEFNHLKSGKEEIVSEENGSQKVVVDKKDAAALLIRKSPKDCTGQHRDRDGEAYLFNDKGTQSESPNQSSVSGKMLGVAVPIGDCTVAEAKTMLDSDEKSKPVDMLKDDKKRTASRLVTSEIKSRSISPGFEIKDGNKRQALTCDFFAKGWCIRGSSCKFLHVKDTESSTKHPERDSPAANLGVDKSSTKRPEIDAPAARWIRETQPDQGLRNTTETSRSLTFNDQLFSTVENRESQGQHQFHDNHRYSFFGRDDFVSVPSATQQFPSSKDASNIFFGSIRGPHFHNDKLNSQKQSDCDGEYKSFRSFSLPSSGFDPQRYLLGLAERREKILSYSWEQSIPFQPSFKIPPTFTSSSELYDPIRDSIDLPGDGLFKLSSSNQGSYQRTYGDFDNRHTTSFYDRVQDKMQGKTSCSTTRSSFVVGVEKVGNASVIVQNETMTKEDNVSGSSRVKNSPKTNKTVFNFDARHQSSGPLHSMDLKEERGKLSNEIVVESKIDGDVEKESKLFRHFRAALIEFVKDLLKPTWRQGHLSKDAHNIIVKRSVEKVLSNMQPEQIPRNMESVEQYLSLSRSKISKLMEAYIVKYGKS